MLQVLEKIPEGLLRRPAEALHEVLSGPTLIHLNGRREAPLFVSVLLHGNETTGWEALRELLSRYEGSGLPRALSVFIGNVQAAREGRRRLDGQPDFNRVWQAGTTPEHAMTHQILEAMRSRGVFASVDVHNNTGVNPHYACVNRLDHRFFHLAVLFGRTVVYFTKPDGVQTSAFAELCPAVVLECGQPGDPRGIAHARDYLDACLHLAEIPEHPVPERDLDLYHTVAVVKVPDYLSFGFGAEAAQVRLRENLDHLNFTELPPGTLLGWLAAEEGGRLVVSDEAGRDVGERYLDYRAGEIRTKLPLMPSMFTLNREVVRQDCLGYFMERLKFSGGAASA